MYKRQGEQTWAWKEEAATLPVHKVSYETYVYPRRAKRALGSEENSGRLLLIDSEMAGRIGLKLGGMVEGMGENVLAKEFFGSVEVDRGQVRGPQVPLLGRGDDKETPNWA